MTNTIRKAAKRNLLFTLLWFFISFICSIPLFWAFASGEDNLMSIISVFSMAAMASIPILLLVFLIKLIVFFIRPKWVLRISIAAKILYFIAISILSFFIFSFAPKGMIKTLDFGDYGRLCQYQANLVVPVAYEYSFYEGFADEGKTVVIISSRDLVWEHDQIIRVAGITSPDSELSWTQSTAHHELRILPKDEQFFAAHYTYNQQIYWGFRILPILLLVVYVVLQLFSSFTLIKILRRRE